MDNEADKDELVRSLDYDDLEKLSDIQLRFAQQISIGRLNKKALDRVNEMLRGKEEEIVGAMSMPPFVYTSPPMKVMAGCEVQLSTLTNAQLMDAHKNVDEFARDGSVNDIRINHELNSNLLAHSLVKFRGEDFGDLALPDNFYEIMATDPEGALDTLAEIRTKRMDILKAMPVSIFQRLVEFYTAFQITIENVTKGEDLAEVLGN